MFSIRRATRAVRRALRDGAPRVLRVGQGFRIVLRPQHRAPTARGARRKIHASSSGSRHQAARASSHPEATGAAAAAIMKRPG
ncbi:hypothetical protein [Sorangium sp. So ce1097]|uniref:hypothetical protein n=1 Tax=Sorangium sp. So ce1097 TaxID=3133330 RepID=UPI003F6423CA